MHLHKHHTNKLTGLWIRCSSSWGGNRSWAPRRRAAWFVHRERRRCGWPHGTWRQSCPGSCAWTGAGGLVCWSPAATPAPVTEGCRVCMRKVIWGRDSSVLLVCPVKFHECVPPGVWPYHDGSEVLALKAADGMVQGLVHRCRDPLGDQTVQINRAA